MKLNNRGYLLVEIIVASVLALTIAYFLIDLTMKLTNENDDYIVHTLLETEKILMTRDVMNDLSKYKLQKIKTDNSTYVELTFEPVAGLNNLVRRVTVTKNADQYIFKYGDYDIEYKINENYFEKKFDDKLKISGVTIENLCYVDGGYGECPESFSDLIVKGMMNIRLDAKTIYSEENYGLELNINYKLNKNNIIIDK